MSQQLFQFELPVPVPSGVVRRVIQVTDVTINSAWPEFFVVLTANAYNITLQIGHQYSIKVLYENSDGERSQATTISYTAVGSVPPQPAAASFASTGSTTPLYTNVVLTLTPPNVLANVTALEVEIINANSIQVYYNNVLSPSITTLTIPNLEMGALHTFKIKHINSSGVSPVRQQTYTPVSTTRPPNSTGGTLTTVSRATNAGVQQVKFNFACNAMPSTGAFATPVNQIIDIVYPTGGTRSQRFTLSVTGTPNQDIWINAGYSMILMHYYVTAGGIPGTATTYTMDPHPVSVPTQPAAMTFVSGEPFTISEGSINVTVTVPAIVANEGVTQNELIITKDSGVTLVATKSFFPALADLEPATPLNYTLPLLLGTLYTFTLKAHNFVGLSTARVQSYTPVDTNGPPPSAGVVYTQTGAQQVIAGLQLQIEMRGTPNAIPSTGSYVAPSKQVIQIVENNIGYPQLQKFDLPLDRTPHDFWLNCGKTVFAKHYYETAGGMKGQVTYVTLSPTDTIAPSTPTLTSIVRLGAIDANNNEYELVFSHTDLNDLVVRREFSVGTAYRTQQTLHPETNEVNVVVPNDLSLDYTLIDYDEAGNASAALTGSLTDFIGVIPQPPIPGPFVLVPLDPTTFVSAPLGPVIDDTIPGADPTGGQPPAPTGAPTRPSITSVTPGQTSVTINVSAPVGGDNITQRHWRVYNGAGATVFTQTDSGLSIVNSKLATGLTASTAYTVEVYDTNAIGDSLKTTSTFTTTS